MADGVLSRKPKKSWGARRGLLLAGALLAPCMPGAGAAQTYEVSGEGEPFLKAAEGRRLADLDPGTRLQLVRTVGPWAEVELEGWVPSDAIAATTREGHDRIVSRSGGVELRDAPSGTVTARLLEGFLLDRVLDREGWTQVRRSGWVRLSALRPASAATSFARPGSSADAGRPPALVAEGRRLMTGEEPLSVHEAPEGGEVAVVRPGTPITVVERGNRWTRVRVEGWVRSDRLVTSDVDSTLVEVSAGALRASPDEYRGMRVRWTVQFIALQRAEAERTDFYEGEPFMLVRAPDPGDGFVYVTVPDELVPAVEALESLERVDILAQVRTGRSALMGVPVLDLLALF